MSWNRELLLPVNSDDDTLKVELMYMPYVDPDEEEETKDDDEEEAPVDQVSSKVFVKFFVLCFAHLDFLIFRLRVSSYFMTNANRNLIYIANHALFMFNYCFTRSFLWMKRHWMSG